VSGELVRATVSGDERDSATGEGADTHRGRRRTEWRVQLDVDRLVEELVEARTSDDTDLGAEIGRSVVERDEHQSGLLLALVVLVEAFESVADEPEPFESLDDSPDPLDDSPDPLDDAPDPLDDSPDPLPSPFEPPDSPDPSVLEAPFAFELTDFPRLSVLKNPLPLNVTPTGWNTFLTDMRSPESGWAYSVSVSSENDCWISIVSPVSTNL
jgi:hypothetical protein